LSKSLNAFLRRIGYASLLLTAPAAAPARAEAVAPRPEALVRIAFSRRAMGNMNRADVTAAMKVWLQTVAKERHLDVFPTAEVFDSPEDLLNAVNQERIDVISVPMDEFILLEKRAHLVGLFASQVNHKASEQYVLLVRRDRGNLRLRDLKGETLVVLDSNRTSMAPLWLDTELLGINLPVAARFFGKVTLAQRQGPAVMPLFFKQAGAALVTRSSFELACELNPQLGKDLRVLMTSPELVPAVGAYRANANSAAVAFYRREGLRLTDSPSGRLILELFQTDGIVELKEADLAVTRAILATRARLLAQGRGKGPPS
jgi:ABC-type phosphate/phosphonate transport system substrate-binding protein